MGTKLPLILIITMINIQKILSFQRIFLKLYSDPQTTRKEDFMIVFNENEDQVDFNDYLKCKNDRFFGPFYQGYKIWRDQINISPFHELKGEFQLLLLNKQPGEIYSDNIYLQYDEERIINIYEIKLLDSNSICNAVRGHHQLYQIKFSL